ncbi:MAG: alkylation response protein AidB-like acyl-CoA dehydrogenase [Kiritimatiellia bacterium]|jgi:alkylation response protein AidB-like acyl-CoA dehydrogenase
MSSTQFTADLQDMKFVLFDQLNIDQAFSGVARFEDFDQETYEATIEEAARVATEVLGPINGPGDRQGCRVDDEGNVTTPDGFAAAWRIYTEGGWVGVAADPEVGGIGLPTTISVACTELFSGAATAFSMYGGLTSGAARVLHQFGPKALRIAVAEKMFLGEWGGTMCLTEAGAGTAVGDNRTKAIPTDEEGVFLLEGEKIFISGADADFYDNVIHLVLARTPNAPAGSKGISIFMVSKFHFDDDLNLAERNGAKVVGLEHKMGINGSATCTLALGGDIPCKGWLIGEEGQGLPIMFHLMNEARLGVGVQGLAIGASAFRMAKSYATDRIQGTSIRNMRDADAPRVAIIEHPDVRRMLMNMKVYVETMRGLCYRVAFYEDLAASEDLSEADRKRHHQRADLLVPIVKSMCTDHGFNVCVEAVQVYGGYGYIGEYPVEQLVRDAKIMSIYEGTNGVQAMDLLGRKLRMKGGALFMGWLQDAQKTVAAASGDFSEEATAIGKALGHLGATAMHLGALGEQGKIEVVMAHATPFLNMMGHVCLALEALDQAVVAKRLIAERGENSHLAGKLLNVRYFTRNMLPNAIAAGKAIQSADDTCLDPSLFT